MVHSLFHSIRFQTRVGDFLRIGCFLHPALINTHSKSTVVKICGSQTIAKDVGFVIVNIDSILK